MAKKLIDNGTVNDSLGDVLLKCYEADVLASQQQSGFEVLNKGFSNDYDVDLIIESPPPSPTPTPSPVSTLSPTKAGFDIQPKPLPEDALHDQGQISLHQQLLRQIDRLKAHLPRISNTHAALAEEFDDYCAFLTVDIADLDITSLWCVGTGLTAHVLALDHAGPGVMTPELEPDITARLNTLMATHTAFILGSPEGAELQQRVLRAREAAQANPDLATQTQAALQPMMSRPHLLAEKARQIVRSLLRGFAAAPEVAFDHIASSTDMTRSSMAAFMRALHPVLLTNEAVTLGMALAGYEHADVLHAAMVYIHDNPRAVAALFVNDMQIMHWMPWAMQRMRSFKFD